ncbi:hypothetical protein [Streptosporangium canum]|uniref:hypothetical protein n=1 Tax=Streptosporangium canum TaxID=324952 RepID=UPI0037B5B9DC
MSSVSELSQNDDILDVIDEVLGGGTPSASGIINALDRAGYVILPPVDDSPAWMPRNGRSMGLVQKCAELMRAELERDNNDAAGRVAAQMRVSRRSVERYVAAARAYGWLPGRRRRR